MKGGLEGERQSQEGESEEYEWLKSGLQRCAAAVT